MTDKHLHWPAFTFFSSKSIYFAEVIWLSFSLNTSNNKQHLFIVSHFCKLANKLLLTLVSIPLLFVIYRTEKGSRYKEGEKQVGIN